MKNIKAVLFDMDGVIVDSMKFHVEAWITVLADYGLGVDPHDIYIREGMSGKSSVAEIFVEKNVAPPPDSDFEKLFNKKHALFEKHNVPIFPLVNEIIDFLKGNRYHTGLVTGSIKRSVEHLLPRQLEESFTTIITADDVLHGKPDPEPYLKALEGLDMAPEDVLVVENAPLGIRAAQNAGMECFAIETTLPAAYLAEASRIFSNHEELFRYFESLL